MEQIFVIKIPHSSLRLVGTWRILKVKAACIHTAHQKGQKIRGLEDSSEVGRKEYRGDGSESQGGVTREKD